MTHRPERFERYTETSDGKGFKIKDCDHLFVYDSHRGWYDEQGNYYNSNGSPAEEPDGSSEPADESSSSGDYADLCDEIAKKYEMDDGYDDDYGDNDQYDDEELENMECIEKNKQILSYYQANKPLRVYYKNMEWDLSDNKILELYKDEILAVVPETDHNGRKNGKGYFVVEGKDKARKIVETEGKTRGKRPIYYTIEQLTELMSDPIDPKYLKNFKKQQVVAQPKSSPPIYKLKQQEVKPKLVEPEKPTHKQQSKIEKKPEPKIQQAVKEVFKTYTFPLSHFQNPQQFKDWMASAGLEFNSDYKGMKKITTNNSVVGTIEMTNKALTAVQDKKFGAHVITFQQNK